MSLTPKEEYAKMVCLFLAEGLRTRRISLQKAAEISGKVLQHINLLDSEHDFLSLIKELTKDFEELSDLEQKINQTVELNQKRKMEQMVRSFVIQTIVSDTKMAQALLSDAAQETATIQTLQSKYPKFNEFSQKL